MELNEIITISRNMLKERTDSLRNDVKRCLVECKDTQAAPFPALLYCFSTIDLLGALYGGNAVGNTTQQARDYMTDIIRYPKEKVYLLQTIFRHKIVHLAQPNPRCKIDSNRLKEKLNIEFGLYVWGIKHNDHNKHLIIEDLGNQGEKKLLCFWVSIESLVIDIIDSIEKPNGYLHRLENEPNLQRNFIQAYEAIQDLN